VHSVNQSKPVNKPSGMKLRESSTISNILLGALFSTSVYLAWRYFSNGSSGTRGQLGLKKQAKWHFTGPVPLQDTLGQTEIRD